MVMTVVDNKMEFWAKSKCLREQHANIHERGTLRSHNPARHHGGKRGGEGPPSLLTGSSTGYYTDWDDYSDDGTSNWVSWQGLQTENVTEESDEGATG